MPRNPAIVYAYKTAVFKVHNPSRRKRAMLDDALKRNHRAYTKLLERLLPRVDEFKEHKAGKRRERAVEIMAQPLVKPLPLSSGAKAGLIDDVAGQISSYIELQEVQEAASRPTAARLTATQESYETRLEQVALAKTLEEETVARDALIAELRAGRLRPVLFVKNRVKDGYLLLWNMEKDRYFIWLNLHSKHSRFAREEKVNGLVDVRTGKVMNFPSRTGALFPVEFSRDFQFQEFMRQARPQSAKLVKKPDCYEVHVTFEYETPKVQPQTMLGVDRGIYNLAALGVIDQEGALVASENIDGRGLRHVQRVEARRQKQMQKAGRRYTSRSRRAMADEAVHVTANRIVETAKAHGSQVVLENLSQLSFRGGKRGRSNFNVILNRTQYEKLRKVLEYKLAVEGLPRPRKVAAAYTSQTCPICGHVERENRSKSPDGVGFKGERFQCQRCGHSDDADANAGRVIALKKLWRDELPPRHRSKTNMELPEELKFEQFIRDRAAMRGDGPGDRMVGTSGGRGLYEAGPQLPGRAGSSLDVARTLRRTKKSAAKPPQLSSSSEIPPLPDGDSDAKSTG